VKRAKELTAYNHGQKAIIHGTTSSSFFTRKPLLPLQNKENCGRLKFLPVNFLVELRK